MWVNVSWYVFRKHIQHVKSWQLPLVFFSSFCNSLLHRRTLYQSFRERVDHLISKRLAQSGVLCVAVQYVLVLKHSRYWFSVYWIIVCSQKRILLTHMHTYTHTRIQHTHTRTFILVFSKQQTCLTHWGRVTHVCVSKQGHHRSRKWLVAWSAPSHYLNRWWNIVNWTLRNKVQWNRKQNSCIFIQENAFENVVWKMAAILSRPQCVTR